MRNEAFYSAVAQVIPTLFIALALEFVALRRMAQEAGIIDPEEIRRRYASDDPPINYFAIWIFMLGLLAFLGEACAVLVLLTGTNTWFPIIAGPLCAIAVLAVTLLVVWIYWVRLAQDRV